MTKTLQITPEVVKADGGNRIASTGAQVGGGAAVVTVAEWLAREIGWDGELPTAVAGAMTVLLAIVASWFKNRGKLRGEA